MSVSGATKRSIQACVRRFGWEIVKLGSAAQTPDELRFPEATSEETAMLREFSAYTYSSLERQWALLKSVEYVNARGFAGDIVECGVWRGGSMMLAAKALQKAKVGRNIHLYDTFAGMTAPSESDVNHSGRSADLTFAERRRDDHTDWAYASIEEVQENFRRAGLLGPNVIFHKGPVEQTLRDTASLPERIALLRLDTDFYESTLVELEVLYPRLEVGGVLLIDDYGAWLGARKAVDEYFKDKPVLLSPIDQTLRVAIKT